MILWPIENSFIGNNSDLRSRPLINDTPTIWKILFFFSFSFFLLLLQFLFFNLLVLRSSIFEEANPDQDFNMNVWRGRILDRVTADVLGNEFGGETFFAVYSRPRPPSMPSPIPAKLGNGRGGGILPETRTFLQDRPIARRQLHRGPILLQPRRFMPERVLLYTEESREGFSRKVARIKRNLIIEGGERKSSDRFSLSYSFQDMYINFNIRGHHRIFFWILERKQGQLLKW